MMLGEETVWEFGNVANVNPPNKKRHKKKMDTQKIEFFFGMAIYMTQKKLNLRWFVHYSGSLGCPGIFMCVCVFILRMGGVFE